MTRSPEAPKSVPVTPVDVAKGMATFGPLNIVAAFYRALAGAVAEELDAVANSRGLEQAAKPNDEQEGGEDEAREEDVIDKVVSLYDVY